MRAVLLALAAACVCAAAPGPGYTVAATKSDLMARDGAGHVVFSARRWVEPQRRAFAAANPGHSCDYEHHITAQSLVGPYLGLRDDLYASCTPEAHPAQEARLLTLDLSAGGHPVTLAALFPPAAVLAALSTAPPLAPLLPNPPPATLPALVAAMSDRLGAGPDDCFTVPGDLPSRFILAGTEGGQAKVTIGLPGAGPCRDNLTPLSVVLPASDALQSALSQAAEGRLGFLPRPDGTGPEVAVRVSVRHPHR